MGPDHVPPGLDATPVACTLTQADLAAQRRRWERLIGQALTGRTETTSGLRLCFRPGPGMAEELRSLAAAESACCPWADWAVVADAGQLALDVRSAGDGVAALHTMFPGATPAGQQG
jgi:hypothetical protein